MYTCFRAFFFILLESSILSLSFFFIFNYPSSPKTVSHPVFYYIVLLKCMKNVILKITAVYCLSFLHTHTHTDTYIYIYIYIYGKSTGFYTINVFMFMKNFNEISCYICIGILAYIDQLTLIRFLKISLGFGDENSWLATKYLKDQNQK